GGEMHGCGNLGTMYAKGEGVEEDLDKAVQLFKKACDGGNMHGCFNLGLMYAFGSGVRDFKKSPKAPKQNNYSDYYK
ncbi:MAG: tetratricopeptide repeat protein, partial [Campylobacter sp.]|uniref:tetratricopeptide repeat protein n=1 Tax=Campylobacter sp. TaxID=205 RepID=UPI00297B99FF